MKRIFLLTFSLFALGVIQVSDVHAATRTPVSGTTANAVGVASARSAAPAVRGTTAARSATTQTTTTPVVSARAATRVPARSVTTSTGPAPTVTARAAVVNVPTVAVGAITGNGVIGVNDATVDFGDVFSSIENDIVNRIFTEIEMGLANIFDGACENSNGIWMDKQGTNTLESSFYQDMFGKSAASLSATDKERGVCVQNTVKYSCEMQDELTGGRGYAKYDAASDTCKFTSDWYKLSCEKIGGDYVSETSQCYL